MDKEAISTPKAPKALGPYSQAIKVGKMAFLSGQIGIIPETNELPEGFISQTHQCIKNLACVTHALGGDLNHIVKLTVYLTDMENFSTLNEIMTHYFSPPYPARAVLAVAKLPREALIEVEGIMLLEK